jgi:arylformamidase
MLYRGMDKTALDRAYNIQAAMGPEALPRYVADWQARSARILAASDAVLDLRYGSAPRQRLDFFRAGRDRPTLAFIHGGFWQRQDKETYRFLAEGALGAGVNFANIEYTLAPERRMDGIVAEIEEAIRWLDRHLVELGGAAGQLHVAGHSAGGHLAAMFVGLAGIRGVVTISGIFDLEPIRLGTLNDPIGMDEAEARRNSPIHHFPAAAAPLIIAYGERELPELCRQSRAYHAAWVAHDLDGRVLPLAGHDHFSILDELARPGGALIAALRQTIARQTQA